MIKKIALSGVFSLCIATLAQATTVSGTFSGTVAAPTGATGALVSAGGGTNSLAWGTASSGSTVVDPNASSSLTINNGSFSKSVQAAGKILFGTITWINQSNWNTGSIWNSNVNLTLDLAGPTNLGPLNQAVSFSIANTTDASYSTSNNNTTGLNPDVISSMVLSSTAFGVPIKLGNGLGLKSVFFDLQNAGSPGTAVNFGGFGSTFDSTTGQWVNREGGTSTIGIYGTVAPVPLPAGVWLLLGGMGSLVALRRRRVKEIV